MYLRHFAAVMLLFLNERLSAQSDWVQAHVLVKADPARIGEVRLGGIVCPVLRIESGAGTPALVMVHAFREWEGRTYEELRVGLADERLGAFEIWVNGASAEYTYRAQFRPGWIATPRTPETDAHLQLPDWKMLQGTLPASELLELISGRFAGWGPVRVFWLDSSFEWFKWALAYDSAQKARDRLAPWMGDSGLALFPVVIPRYGAEQSQPTKARTWLSSQLGVEEWIAGANPGEALKLAIRESKSWVALTLQVPGVSPEGNAHPKRLEVLDRDTRSVLFSRQFVALGRTQKIPPSTPGELERKIFRMVRRLPVQEAKLTRTCGGAEAESPDMGYLLLQGLELPPTEPLRSEVLIARRELGDDSSRGFSVRDEKAMMRRIGADEACIGPVPLKQANVFVYSPRQQWMAVLGIRKQPGMGKTSLRIVPTSEQ